MKLTTQILIIGMVMMSFAQLAFAADAPAAPAAIGGKEAKLQTQCPIMGGKIDKTAFADYQGKRVYFCCISCADNFKKEPEKYLKTMEEKGEKAHVLQTLDPVDSKPVKKDLFKDIDGFRVYFSSKESMTQFAMTPADYMTKMDKDGIVFEVVKK